ncbi:MAG: AMP-dependent synthetase/ligase, partial [Myxococcales bacterium]
KDIAGYIYTSGTTGNPKGVLLSHSNLACNVSAALDVFPIGPENRSLSFLPWAHSFGQTAEMHTLIAAGASMGICEGIPKIIDNLAEVQPSILMAVPNIFNKIYDGVQKQMAQKPAIIQSLFRNAMRAQTMQKQGKSVSLGDTVSLAIARKLVYSKIVARFGGKLQFAMSGGAALSKEVAEFVDNLGIMVFEGYGLTETSPVAAVNTPAARRIGSVGKPIAGVRIVLDHEASGSPDEGEIVVYGHNVMQGYYNLPEESAKVFTPDGGFRTGDLGRFDSDGFLYITGRLKELYKLENGKYVAPAALESKLQLSPLILQAMVYGANRPYNVAVLVPDMLALKEWAASQGIDSSNPNQLVADDRVRARYKQELETYGKEFKGFEAVRDFILVAEEFTVANDMLTPKLSMKRRNVLKRYEAEIEALYAKAPVAKTA